MYSHHSHSGDYVAHGVDPLEDIVFKVIEMEFDTYCLTEHIPRVNAEYLYPEERQEGLSPLPNMNQESLKILKTKFLQYLDHARTIKQRCENDSSCKTKFIVGCELECCDIEHIKYGKYLMEKYSDDIKFGVGSIHHIRGIPIDFSALKWKEALDSCGDNIIVFLTSYFEMQYTMIRELKPMVVGHFDIYKLMAPADMYLHPQSGSCAVTPQEGYVSISAIDIYETFPQLKDLVIRNMKAIDKYGGAIEINTAGFRKGLSEPYPGRKMCDLAKEYCSARFVLSDDAHAVSQVGTCYKQVLDFIVNVIKLNEIYYLSETSEGIEFKKISVKELQSSSFWKQF